MTKCRVLHIIFGAFSARRVLDQVYDGFGLADLGSLLANFKIENIKKKVFIGNMKMMRSDYELNMLREKMRC